MINARMDPSSSPARGFGFRAHSENARRHEPCGGRKKLSGHEAGWNPEQH
jgi:hypothetical protein